MFDNGGIYCACDRKCEYSCIVIINTCNGTIKVYQFVYHSLDCFTMNYTNNTNAKMSYQLSLSHKNIG